MQTLHPQQAGLLTLASRHVRLRLRFERLSCTGTPSGIFRALFSTPRAGMLNLVLDDEHAACYLEPGVAFLFPPTNYSLISERYAVCVAVHKAAS